MTSVRDDEPIAFCRRWNTITATRIDPLTPAQAERMDRAKHWYTVVVGEPAAPRCYAPIPLSVLDHADQLDIEIHQVSDFAGFPVGPPVSQVGETAVLVDR